MIDVHKMQSGVLAPWYRGAADGQWGPLTQAAMDAYQRSCGTAVPLWLVAAEREMGVSEITGARSNPRILEYHNTTTLAAEDDEVPWCSAFVNFCMASANRPRTRSAAARSWLRWGSPLTAPRYGCVAVLRRGDAEWQGHVGFLVAEDRDSIALLGGNQHDRVQVSVFRRTALLAFRWCA